MGKDKHKWKPNYGSASYWMLLPLAWTLGYKKAKAIAT